MNNIGLTSDALNISKNATESINGQPVLCTLEGIVADFKNPTRNGRFYSKKLWEKALQSELVQDQIANGGIMMELNHPADRDDTDLSCVAAIMPELPKETSDGKLFAKVHIIDTPMGRIANTLARYGYKLGISSRGNGDIEYDGSVNEDTYQLQCWDLVAIPSVKDARLSLVTESLNSKTLTESLNKIVEEAKDDDKKLITEKLAQLNITLTSENAGEAREVSIPVDMTVSDNGDVNIETVTTLPEDDPGIIGETPEVTVTADVVMAAQAQVEQEVEAEVADDTVDNSTEDDNIQAEVKDDAVDNVEVSVIDDLQEALRQNGTLKQSNESLQNSLSVSIAKEQQLNEELSRCKSKIVELVESQKQITGLKARSAKLEENVEKLNESVNMANSQNQKLGHTINLQKININQLSRRAERIESKHNALQEKLILAKEENQNLKNDYISKLNKQSEDTNSLKESFDNQLSSLKNEADKLLAENKKLKSQLSTVVESYARLKGQISGVDYKYIKDNMKDNSIEDIDRITESYVSRKMMESRLPFSSGDIKKIRYNRPVQGYTNPINSDDVYDE